MTRRAPYIRQMADTRCRKMWIVDHGIIIRPIIIVTVEKSTVATLAVEIIIFYILPRVPPGNSWRTPRGTRTTG